MKLTLRIGLLAMGLLLSAAAFSDKKTDKIDASGLRIAVKEGGEARLNVVLKEQPKKDVTVKVRSSNLQRMYVVEGAGLIFTKDDWDKPQSAFFKTIDDDICMGSELIDVTVVTLSKDTAFNGCELIRQILVNDDEKPGVLLSAETVELDKETRAGQLEVHLRSKPAEDVLVEMRVTDKNIEVDNPVIFFDANNWNTPQRVNLKADARVSGREAIRLIGSSASSVEAYDGIKVSAEIRIEGVDVTSFAAAEKAEQMLSDAETSQNNSAAAQKALLQKQKEEEKAALKKQKEEEKERWKNMTPAQKKKAKELAARKKEAEKKKAARLKEIAKKKAAKLKEMEKKKKAREKEAAKKQKNGRK